MIMTELPTTVTEKAPTAIDAGVALHSPSTELMKLVNIHNTNESNWTEFQSIVNYIQNHLFDIIYEIHVTYDKLLIDDGNTQINCPPTNESVEHVDSESSSTLLLRTLSEQESVNGNGIIAKREIKVYDCGLTTTTTTSNDNEEGVVYHTILIREDIEKASADVADTHPVFTENSVKVTVAKKQK